MPARGRALRGLAVLVALLPAAFPPEAAEPRAGLDACDAEVRERPEARSAYDCYLQAAQGRDAKLDALRRIDALLALDPDRAGAHYARLAWLVQLDDPRAAEAAPRAIERLDAVGDADGAIRARAWYARVLIGGDRFEEAQVQLDEATARLAEAREPETRIELLVQSGWTALRRADYSAARVHFLEAEQALTVDSAPGMRKIVLGGVAAIAWTMGRLGEALSSYREIASFAPDDPATRSNLLGAAYLLWQAGELPAEELRRYAEDLLSLVPAGGAPTLEQRAHEVLAELTEGEEARAHCRALLEISRRARDPIVARGARRVAALRMIGLGPEPFRAEGWAILEELAVDSRRHPRRNERVRDLDYLALAALKSGPTEEAIARHLELFDAIEALRDLQLDEEVRIVSFARHAYKYQRLAAELLESAAADPAAVALAFGIQERMRARALLDALDAAGAAAASAGAAGADPERARLLRAIGETQRALLAAESEEEHERRLAELGRLEQAERTRRLELARDDPAFGALRAPDLASLDSVRAALGPGEALLSFLVREPVGPSWLIAASRERVAVTELPPRSELTASVKTLLGLVDRRDGAEAAWAAQLGRRLVGPALERLGPSIDRLIVVADGPLWLLPFDSLRLEPAGAPLGAR